MMYKLKFHSYRHSLFYNESIVANHCLIHGANLLLDAEPYSRLEDHFYPAFFNLSIGIERFLKVMILTLIDLNDDTQKPNQTVVKGFRHDIIELYNFAVKEINLRIPEENHLSELTNKHQFYCLFDFLNQFSIKDRYYNIDKISHSENSKADSSLDPISRWLKLSFNQFSNFDKKSKVRLEFDELNSNLKKIFKQATDSDSIFTDIKNQTIENKEVCRNKFKVKKTSPVFINEIRKLLRPILNYINHIQDVKRNENSHLPDFNKPFISIYSVFTFFNENINDSISNEHEHQGK